MRFGSSGGIEGAEAKLTVGRGRRISSVHGGFEVHASEPRQVEGRGWVVEWQRQLEGGGSIGRREGGRSASVSASGTEVFSGVEVFDSRAEAESFAQDAARQTARAGAAGMPSTADAVLALDVGESRSLGTGMRVGMSGTAQAHMIQAGAHTSSSMSERTKVTRSGETTVQVAVTHGAGSDAGASLGTAGVSMQGSQSRGESQEHVVEFDLATPAGRAGFEAYMRAGELGDAGRLVSTSEEESRGSSTNVGIFGARFFSDSRVSERVTHRGDDRIEEHEGSRGTGATVPLVGSYSTRTGLHARDVNGEDTSYAAISRVSSSEPASTNSGLARATGVGSTSMSARESSGTWTVSTQFSDAEIDAFVEIVRSGRANVDSLMHYKRRAIDLEHELSRAGHNVTEVNRALSEFIAATGDRGTQFIRRTIRAEPTYDLFLEGDPNFPGEQARVELEGRIEGYRAALATPGYDLRALARSMDAERQALRPRLEAIHDPSRYTDLPIGLRVQEIKRVRGWLETFDDLVEQALSKAEARGDQEDVADESWPTFDPSGYMPGPTPAQELGRLRRSLATFDELLVENKERAEEASDLVRHSRWVHDGAYRITKRSARDSLTAGFWRWSDGEESDAYERADRQFDRGDERFRLAKQAEAEAETLRLNYRLHVGVLERELELIRPLRDKVHLAERNYASAARHFERAEEEYEAIRQRHAHRKGWWEGFKYELPPGAA